MVSFFFFGLPQLKYWLPVKEAMLWILPRLVFLVVPGELLPKLILFQLTEQEGYHGRWVSLPSVHRMMQNVDLHTIPRDFDEDLQCVRNANFLMELLPYKVGQYLHLLRKSEARIRWHSPFLFILFLQMFFSKRYFNFHSVGLRDNEKKSSYCSKQQSNLCHICANNCFVISQHKFNSSSICKLLGESEMGILSHKAKVGQGVQWPLFSLFT